MTRPPLNDALRAAHAVQNPAFRSPRSARGFSLVELLVVIGIVGVLVGLVLPAVQRARDAARRTQCGNNVRQVALGLSSYESGQRRFPAGCDMVPRGVRLPTGTEIAWSAFILPYLDEAAIASRFDLRERWDAPGGNDTASDAEVAPYVCPSGIVTSIGKADYGGVGGSWIMLDEETFFGPAGLHNGMLFAVDGEREPVRANGVSDGLSRTLLVAEAVDRGDPLEPADQPDATGRWARLNFFSQSEAFINTRGSDISSNHTGGATVAFADAHVAFLNDTMDPAVLSAICTRNCSEAIASAGVGQ